MNMESPPTSPDHRDCVGGCLLKATPRTREKRATKYALDGRQIDELLELLAGRCMMCLDCHATVVDIVRDDHRARGLLCRFCKTRIATYQGSYGPDADFPLQCRCRHRSPVDDEWEPQIKAALAHYLSLTALVDRQSNREHFDRLIGTISADGPDPHGIWEQTALDTLPQLASITEPAPDYGGVPPLSRQHCPSDCRAHPAHIYISCFATPTVLRDADTQFAVMHYVGFTRQHPPMRRVSQHGPACREALVAIIPGACDEEEALKAGSLCPRCGLALAYTR